MMRRSFILAAACALLTMVLSLGPVYAEGEFDKNIERAAIDIAVEKLGEIRGPHEINQPYYLHPPIEARSAANGLLVPATLQDGPEITPVSLQGN